MQWVRNPFSPPKAKDAGGGKQLQDGQASNSHLHDKDGDSTHNHNRWAAADDDSVEEEVLVRIGGAVVHLVEGQQQEAGVELGSGEFRIVRLRMCMGVVVKVGEHLRWPLAKDEPTLKIDSSHYLFSLGGDDPSHILNYGVTFPNGRHLETLDKCLQQYACFCAPSTENTNTNTNTEAFWATMAPRVDDYNSALAKAIAAGSGQIIKGIFYCSNSYSSQIRKGADRFVRAPDAKISYHTTKITDNSDQMISISPRTKRSIRRVKKLSRMTENLSKNALAGVVTASGAVSGPIFKSKAGQKLFTVLPGEVLLASLDAFNKVLDAAELAGKNALSTTSKATTEIVTERFGEDAGELTHDGFAVAGHVIGTAWNVAKIRKAINPATNGNISSTVLKNARKAK